MTADPAGERLPLTALLSQVLVAFTIQFDNVEHQMPHRTSEAAENTLGRLRKSGHVVVGPDPAGSRTWVARLTATGAAAQRAYREQLDVIEQRWSARIGGDQVRSLRQVLERLVGGRAVERSPLLAGLQPYPDGWRASIAAPRTLPHYPLVLHRGGFPDGS